MDKQDILKNGAKAAGLIGAAWGGYNFVDLGLLVGKYEWATKDRIVAAFFFAGILSVLSPSLVKVDGFPSIISYCVGIYLFSAAIGLYNQ